VRVQAISDEIAGELKSIGVPPSRIVQIPNGLDLERFSPASESEKHQLRSELGLPPSETLVLCTGRLAAYKGVRELLEVWRSADLGATLVLVGSRDHTDNPMTNFEPPPRTIVRDFTHRIADYYRACDIFARPSYYEGMPNSVLEAMACGLPVVATPVGATPSLVTNGEEGFLVTPGSAAEVRAALSRLIENAGARRRMGQNARQKAERFSIDTVVDQIEHVYDSIVET
jgi:glycosyltransferase involved in cell wall biosynthesis